MANISEAEIRQVISQVLNNMQAAPAKDWDSTHYGARKFVGIYSDMNEAIDAATEGYKAVRAMSVEKREKIITAIRELTYKEAPVMAEIGVKETGMGKVEHKRLKHILVVYKTSCCDTKRKSIHFSFYLMYIFLHIRLIFSYCFFHSWQLIK